MTPADSDRFADVFAALCRAFAKPVNDETALLGREYFEALADYPIALVERAKLALVRSCKYFPRVRDWREACDESRSSALPSAPALIVHDDGDIEPVFSCLKCQDTGWRPACGCRLGEMNWRGECPQHERTANGERVYRQAMMTCACRDANPEYQRHRPRVGRT
jgi:hypothetical protein